jgi:hypothetical protein
MRAVGCGGAEERVGRRTLTSTQTAAAAATSSRCQPLASAQGPAAARGPAMPGVRWGRAGVGRCGRKTAAGLAAADRAMGGSGCGGGGRRGGERRPGQYLALTKPACAAEQSSAWSSAAVCGRQPRERNHASLFRITRGAAAAGGAGTMKASGARPRPRRRDPSFTCPPPSLLPFASRTRRCTPPLALHTPRARDSSVPSAHPG